MAQPFNCTDLLIRIGAPLPETGAYPVEATIDGDSFFYGGTLCLDWEKLRQWELDPARYGGELLGELFSEPIARAYERGVAKAQERSGGRLRVRLQIDPKAASLQAVRWERLCHRREGRELPFAVSAQTPFSRFTGMEQGVVHPLTERPIRMVVAISNPSDLQRRGLAQIDLEQEVRSLCQGLGNLRAGNEVTVTINPGRTGLTGALRESLAVAGYHVRDGVTSLTSLLSQLRGCHVFHFLGHGAFRPGSATEAGTAALFLESEDGSSVLVKDTDLVPRLAAASPRPHLVFLAACESARRGEGAIQPFVGLGPKMVEAGVPAVVAMQDKVPMALATDLTRLFYEALLRHGVIDQALNEARWLLYDTHSADWSVPVLFMRAKEGRVFEPNPVRVALAAMVQRTEEAFADAEPPLPIEVVRVTSDQGYLGLERFEQSEEAGVDIGVATREMFQGGETTAARFGALLGREGTARSTHLKFLVGEVAGESLSSAAERLTIPLYADLEGYYRSPEGFGDPFEAFLCGALEAFWPGIVPAEFRSLLDNPSGQTFLFLLDGSDGLSDHQRAIVWDKVYDFVRKHGRHRYLLTCDLHRFAPDQLPVTDVLVAKTISRPRVVAYLKAMRDPAGGALLRALENGRLFDLAGLPWLLVQMLRQTRQDKLPHSRTSVLKNLVDMSLSQVSAEGGKWARADETLQTLARELQFTRRRTLSVDRALEVMAPLRGSREYRLYDLLQDFIEQQLLVRVGQDYVRFAYPAIQSFCCAAAINAMPDWLSVIDDVTATLGRMSRLRWWEDTLVLLSGMTKGVDALVRWVLYGSSFTQGEQVFLAARCIQESGQGKVSEDVLDQVVDALVWRTRTENEPRTQLRSRAIRALGELQIHSAIPHLVSLVVEPVRRNWLGDRAMEFSSVRLAAIGALGQMLEPARAFLREHYPQLDPLFGAWDEGDVAALGKIMTEGEASSASIAAFLLSSLPSRDAVDWLLSAFRSIDVTADTRWALADALSLVDPVSVTREAILPFIDKDAAKAVNLPAGAWRRRAGWYERVVYLIGQVKPADERTDRFLDRCLYEYKDVWLKGRAIRAIGALRRSRYKPLLEQIALGDFQAIPVSDRIKPEETDYLRCLAMETLADIGDEETLRRLRERRGGWTVAMEQAFYRASEEIYWRASSQQGYTSE